MQHPKPGSSTPHTTSHTHTPTGWCPVIMFCASVRLRAVLLYVRTRSKTPVICWPRWRRHCASRRTESGSLSPATSFLVPPARLVHVASIYEPNFAYGKRYADDDDEWPATVSTGSHVNRPPPHCCAALIPGATRDRNSGREMIGSPV